MNLSEEWRDIKYREVFDQETTGLIRRRQFDPGCKVEDLEAILRNLYIMDGANLDAGALQCTIVAATIAAYEEFIANWRKES